MLTPVLVLSLAGPLAPVAAVNHGAEQSAPQPLEAWLARLRERERAELEALRPEVEQRLVLLGSALGNQRGEELRRARAALVELGPRAAPLLVPELEPGADASKEARARAREVARVLVELPTPAATDPLLVLLFTGSAEARTNAARVLGTSPEPGRAAAGLGEAWRASAGNTRFAGLRAVVLRSLAHLGGEESLAIVSEALEETDTELVALALDALAESQRAESAPRVLALTKNLTRAAALVPALLRYWRARPELARGEPAQALLELGLSSSLPIPDRVRILEALPELSGGLDSDAKRKLKALAEHTSGELREAALVALVLSGERGAKKDLLEPYDTQVDKNPRWAKPYETRAGVLVRIGEHKDAIRDYKQALDLAENDPRMPVSDAWIGLARCYARTGKLKDAAQTLRRSPLSLSDLAQLAADPDFAKLVESRYAEDVFPQR